MGKQLEKKLDGRQGTLDLWILGLNQSLRVKLVKIDKEKFRVAGIVREIRR